MPFKKHANAVVQEPILKLMDWEKMYGQKVFGRKSAALSKVADKQSQYILSHCTIMSSVAVEQEPYDYLIRPASAAMINSNDDGWTSKVLLMSYKTFEGSFNFVEHYQNSAYSKGIILSAVPRKITLTPHPDDYVIFIDILVATDCAHEKLCNEIRSGEVKYMSMGCVTDLVTCSFCGARVTDASSYCHHLNYLKGTFQADEDGVPRRIGELCFPPSTRVVVGDGTRHPISSIEIGDKVLSHTGKIQTVTNKFSREYTGNITTIKVLGVPQVLKSTPNHPYWAISPRTHCTCGCGKPLGKRARKFMKGEYTRAFLPGHNPSKGGQSTIGVPDFDFKNAEDLRVGDLVAIPVPSQTITPKAVDPIRAELLGWFLAEGSYYKYNGEGVGVTFTLNAEDELEVAHRLQELLEQAFPPELRKGVVISDHHKRARVHCYDRSEGGKKMVVNYGNQEAVNWFLLHAGEYAETKQLSPEAILWPVDIQEILLRAYVLGDGTVDKTARHSVASISETLISQMQLVAARCGLWTRRQVIFNGKAVTLDSVLSSALRDDNNFRPLHTLHFQPSTKATEFFGIPKGLIHVRNISPAWREHDGYLLYPVTEVGSEVYTGTVHNLEVGEDHSYLVEGIAVHNCGHHSLPGGGVKFVEASWVAQPAFPGAVKRNIVADNWVGPATPYTTPIEASKAAAFNKAASVLDPAELLLGRDNEGQFLR